MIALLVAGAFFMENLDGTVITTAVPQMARSFGVNPVDLNIGMTAFMLALAVFIPISGWLADRFGARTIFAGAIGIFTASSVLCGLSNGLWEFTAVRVLQGFGGAMMVPVGRLVVLRTTAKQDLLRSIAYITWPGLAAPILGPPVGGFITTYFSWRWIFFLNVPLGILGMVLALSLIPRSRDGQKRSFDWIGFVLTSAACVSLMYGLDLIGRQEMHWLTTGLLLGCSLTLGAASVWHLRRHPHPLIDLSVASSTDLCRDHLGRFSVSHRDWRDTVSSAAHVPDRIRHECVGLGPVDSSGLRRQSYDEAGDNRGASALWISQGVNRKRPACRGNDIRVLPLFRVHSEGDHCSRIVCRRFIQVDAIYCPDVARLRRHPSVRNERSEHFGEFGSANDVRHGHCLRRDCPASRRPVSFRRRQFPHRG